MTDKWHGGKGDKSRPSNQKKYQDNWEKIFNKPVDKKK
jgi:hypothetical protein